jgi:hypothetical protein
LPTNDSFVPLSYYAKDDMEYRSQILQDKELFAYYLSNSTAPKKTLQFVFHNEMSKLLGQLQKSKIKQKKQKTKSYYNKLSKL